MERSHVLLLRIKRHLIQTLHRSTLHRSGIRFDLSDPCFHRGYEKCAFGWIPDDGVPVLSDNPRVVAEITSLQRPDHLFSHLRRCKLTFRLVSDPAHPVIRSPAVYPRYGHLVLSKCTGLIRADHGGAPERLCGRQPFYDRIFACHRGHTDRQSHRHHRRQPLRYRSDRERHGCKKRVDHTIIEPYRQRKVDDGDREDRNDQESGKLLHLPRKRSYYLFSLLYQFCYPSKLCMFTGSDNDPNAYPFRHKRAAEYHTSLINDRCRSRDRVGMLGHRHGFACDRCFICA